MPCQVPVQKSADQDGQKRSHRCRKAHRSEVVREQDGGKEGCRDPDKGYGEHVVEEGVETPAPCTEVPGEAELHPGKEGVETVGPKVLGAVGDDGGIPRHKEGDCSPSKHLV